MKKKYYLPTKELERATWLNNFIAELTNGYAGTFGLSPAIMALLTDFLDFYVGLLSQVEVAKQLVQSLTKYKNEFCDNPKGSPLAPYPVVPISLPALPTEGGLWAYIRALVQMIKKHPDYTASAGEALGIIGDDYTVNVDGSKPELKFVKDPHGWRIDFNLLQFFEGVSIYKKLPSATEFTHLATDRHSPYVDNSPVENGTQYYAFFLLGDDEVGQQSEITTLKVSS